MFRWFRAFALLIALAFPTLAFSTLALGFSEATKVVRVSFRDGHASLAGRVHGYETVDYVFPAGARESIKIHFDGDKRYSNYFILTAPGATEAMYDGSSGESDYEGVASVAGDYTVRVFLMRNDARRNRTANYRLSIDLGQKSASNAHGPDFADGLSGGPDFWEVRGVPAGDALSLRASASPKGRLVARVPNGAPLRNLGCKFTRGSRWCHVATQGGAQGWANGKFLREGGGW